MRSKAPEMEVFLLQVSEQVNESLVVDVLVVLRGQKWKKMMMMMMMIMEEEGEDDNVIMNNDSAANMEDTFHLLMLSQSPW